MLLVSQNLSKYMPITDDSVVRINLAWVDSIEKLALMVENISQDIFLDLPIGRTKPPNNNYSLEDVKKIIVNHSNIKYLAVSNIESSKDLEQYLKLDRLIVIPKIESLNGVMNIGDICSSLGDIKIIMLDHDDLFSDLIRNGINASNFFKYIKQLDNYCKDSGVRLLKTRGVIFSDTDKYYF